MTSALTDPGTIRPVAELNGVKSVPVERYAAMRDRFIRTAEVLDVIEMWSVPELVQTTRRLGDILDNIDQRLAEIEKRLDDAGVPPMAAGIPDGEEQFYFAGYSLVPNGYPVDSRQLPRVLVARAEAYLGAAQRLVMRAAEGPVPEEYQRGPS